MNDGHDFWPDLGYGLLILAGVAGIALFGLGMYQLWSRWHWIIWIPIGVVVILIVATLLGHLSRDLFGDRGHHH